MAAERKHLGLVTLGLMNLTLGGLLLTVWLFAVLLGDAAGVKPESRWVDLAVSLLLITSGLGVYDGRWFGWLLANVYAVVMLADTIYLQFAHGWQFGRPMLVRAAYPILVLLLVNLVFRKHFRQPCSGSAAAKG